MKNLKRFALTLSLLVSGLVLNAQNALNISQLGRLTYNEDLSEVRGALHNGREYALVGVRNGFSIVDVQDPTNPTEVFFEPGPSSTWRDPFYHNGYAYCVTEGGGGLLIVDMSPLPGSTNLPTTLYTGTNIVWESAHNMFIDEDNDKAYIFGTDNIDGAIILDISNPMAPAELGVWNDFYIHDGFVRGDTLWAACLEDGAFVVDVSVPSNPVILANWDTPSEFAHNIWPSDDNRYCYTTDEVNSGFVAAYDMSNFSNVQETDKYRHPLSEGTIPHNSHFMNDYVITAHYRDGVTILDASNPANMVLTGYFDTSPFSGGGFNGAWGAWPYMPSGNLLVSDIEEGLFVLGPTYTRGARLEGNVKEFGTGIPLNDVLVEIQSIGISRTTNLFGDYAAGTESAGTYSVTFQKAGYLSQTISGVELVNGQVEILDVELVPATPFSLSGLVVEEGSGNPIEGASVVFENQFFDLDFTTNPSGAYVDSEFYAGQYEVSVGAWGYEGQCITIDVTSSLAPPTFELTKGYFDDFNLDLGWTVSGDAAAGVWERGSPVGTDFDGQESNPGADVSSDCGEATFVTGNAGGSAGADDVDDGTTILTSPLMDLTSYRNPAISFDYWFFNAGGSSAVNDDFVVKISNGTDVVTLQSLAQSNGQWQEFISGDISSVIPISSTISLILEVSDSDPGHLVEGAVDDFKILETTGIEEDSVVANVRVFPNPASGFVNVELVGAADNASVRIIDLRGKQVGVIQNLNLGVTRLDAPSVAGIYLLELEIGNSRIVKRLLIHD
mgnify:CR=1 FL=1